MRSPLIPSAALMLAGVVLSATLLPYALTWGALPTATVAVGIAYLIAQACAWAVKG